MSFKDFSKQQDNPNKQTAAAKPKASNDMAKPQAKPDEVGPPAKS